MILEPKLQIDHQNDRKALAFSLKATWHFAMSKSLIKPVENRDFGDASMGKSTIWPAWVGVHKYCIQRRSWIDQKPFLLKVF